MRDCSEVDDLNSLKWIQGVDNFATALTKPNLGLSVRLNCMMAKGVWDDDIDRVSIELWK